ncbi:MAG: hypothetical protein K2W96_14920 [Gemmataceae bacterium]|nr:hypothetical protein [Gemmataceae bacterium]
MPPVLPKLLVQALALTRVPVGDFLGPSQKGTTLHIAWEDKWAALQAFAEGRPKEHEAIRKRLREHVAYAKDRYTTSEASAKELEAILEEDRKNPGPMTPRRIEQLERTTENLAIYRASALSWRGIHMRKLKEEAAMLALGKHLKRLHDKKKAGVEP